MARAGVEPATFHFSGERCYQLSYLARTAVTSPGGNVTASATPTGLEPATSAVTGRRANQLRYGALTAHSALPGARETIAQVWDPHEPTLFRWPEGASARHAIVAAVASPSSSGLGHRPFTAAARVRIPLGVRK